MGQSKTISIITPTYNCIRVMDTYMKAVLKQNYPHDKMEVIIADAGKAVGVKKRMEI